MASDRELKLRIRSVSSIGQLTKAMKMVASAQIRKVESRVKASRPYADKLKNVVQEMTAQMGPGAHELLVERPIERVGVIVVSSDNGLCGSYNANVLRLASHGIDSLPDGQLAKLVVLGGKAARHCRRRGLTIDILEEDWKPGFELARRLADQCAQWYLANEVDEIRCYYTEAISMLSNQPRELRMLPLAAIEEGQAISHVPYIFEPSAEEALNVILPSYLRVMMQQVLLESKTSELGSRLKAMTNASDNAEKLAGELTLQYYRIRQNNITNEIIEISSGAEALKS